MKVYWTDRAKRRLKLIEEYIAQDAPEVAQRTVRRILARSRQIGELPQSGRRVPEFDHPEYGKSCSVHTASSIEFSLIG